MSCCAVPRKPLDECAAALREPRILGPRFPMYVMPLDKVLQMTQVKMHQELLGDGVLRIFDPSLGKAMFVSHQWTAEGHPDPDGQQLKVFQQAMSNLLTGRMVAKPTVWAETVFNLAGGSAQSFTTTKLTERSILVWYDYFCIPQYPGGDPGARSLSGSKFRHQRNAIASIPAYIARCEFFVALCPMMKHPTRSTLSVESWEQRGWCRAEAVVRDLSVKNGLTLIVEGPQQVSLAVTYSMLKAPGDGQFSMPEDRKSVGEIVKEVLQNKLDDSLRARDFPKYRFLLNHQFAILRNSETSPIPGLVQDGARPSGPESIGEDFLLQNGFEKISERDRCGWSPLLYAALGGNPQVVEALLLQGADPNDYIRKVQNHVLFVKGSLALSICAVQKNNEAMKVLLRFRANPNKLDTTKNTPLFYVSHSDNVEGARILLEAGANALARNMFATNVFDQACLTGASQLLKEVLNVPPDAVSQREAIGMAMTMGLGNPETLAVLLEMGCDKDGTVSPRNSLAKFYCRVMELKHRVAPTPLTTLFYHATGATPLMRSILIGSYVCAHLLIESSARVDLRNSRHQTAFDLAVLKQAPMSLLWQLWKHGAGDHATKESIRWWCSTAPERFPVAIDHLSDFTASKTLEDEEADASMISVHF